MDKEGRKFEDENITFHKRVREGYLKQARRDPERWLIVDAVQEPEAVSTVIWARVKPLLPSRVTKASVTLSGEKRRRLI